jgi:hypothetical protein
MLKQLATMHLADERYANIVVGSPPYNIRFITLADHHGHIAEIELTTSAPEGVRNLFERARNAYLYAWFVYDLTPLAQSQAYAALEMALRDKLGPPPAKQSRWSGLKQLLQTANERGHFSDLQLPSFVIEGQRLAYFDAIADMTTRVRNDLAHGSNYLGTPNMALDALRDCAELINCLYPS